MSKTTIALLIILFIFIGLLLYSIDKSSEHPLLPAIEKQFTSASPTKTSLSLSTNEQELHIGQTVTIAILIRNATPSPAVAQVELAYDPMALTILDITPETFFTNPIIALQNIDPNTGRISYALRCPSEADCVNSASPTLATITARINPYILKDVTTISFLPKTVIRTQTGKELLRETNNLALELARTTLINASPTATASSGAIHNTVIPLH